jgi:hypothetical protein
VTDFVETPEGQRIVTAIVEAIREPASREAPSLDSIAKVALRAALSVTGECKTCHGIPESTVDEWPCSACTDGREPLLVLREQS